MLFQQDLPPHGSTTQLRQNKNKTPTPVISLKLKLYKNKYNTKVVSKSPKITNTIFASYIMPHPSYTYVIGSIKNKIMISVLFHQIAPVFFVCLQEQET